jgi:hypothetical protein
MAESRIAFIQDNIEGSGHGGILVQRKILYLEINRLQERQTKVAQNGEEIGEDKRKRFATRRGVDQVFPSS